MAAVSWNKTSTEKTGQASIAFKQQNLILIVDLNLLACCCTTGPPQTVNRRWTTLLTWPVLFLPPELRLGYFKSSNSFIIIISNLTKEFRIRKNQEKRGTADFVSFCQLVHEPQAQTANLKGSVSGGMINSVWYMSVSPIWDLIFMTTPAFYVE